MKLRTIGILLMGTVYFTVPGQAQEDPEWQPHLETLKEIADQIGCSLEEVYDKGIGAEFADPETCAVCHPRQYQEWLGSSHSYGAFSPTFNTFEMVARRVLQGAVANNGSLKNFCNKCHTPTGDVLGEFTDYTTDAAVTPMRESLSAVSARGISCESCHRVKELDTTADPALGKLGDGVGNTSLLYDTQSGLRRGPLTDPVSNGFHSVSSRAFEFMTGDGLCAACHDVRIGQSPDVATGEPFKRLENLVTEFRQGPYYSMTHPRRMELEAKHPLLKGRIGNCQDCHMSLFPVGQVGQYPTDLAAVQGTGDAPLVERRVSTHYFTGVDIALVDFPNQDDPALDKNGLPKGLNQRRKLLLQKAVEIDLDQTASEAVAGATFPLRVRLTNVGAGHNVVAGFSQERQMWLETTVRDASGGVVFESGYLRRFDPETGAFLVDPDGDGDHDEEWADVGVAFADNDSQGTPRAPYLEVPGPDNQLVTFTNHFEFVDEEGHHKHLHLPFPPANRFNNFRTLRPFEPVEASYQVPIPATAEGPLSVSVRLRYRHFLPSFLRYLKDRDGTLVNEEMIDKVEIIDMASAQETVNLSPLADLTGDGFVDHEDLMMIHMQWHQGTKSR